MTTRRTWDIFCAVVDNYGDIGVGFRLARQLAAEHGLRVRLWVNDLATFRRICPEIDPNREAQTVAGIEVRRWAEPFPETAPAEVVVEAFGCRTPERYVAAMAALARKPAWINLEYLSAEPWVSGCHGLPSPHPRLPLVKYFFFPGFVAGSGGLLAESDLARRRDAFRRDSAARAGFWRELGLPEPGPEELVASLFCYENAALPELLTAWSAEAFPVRCLVPEGQILPRLSAWFGETARVGSALSRGGLEVRILPFTAQARYDRLLWVCDLNFVRGEDSFVRAQWAARPLVWHIYPQRKDAHWAKLSAFLDRYGADLAPDAAAWLRRLWEAWNRGEGMGAAWSGFGTHRAALEAHARRWAGRLAAHGDLAGNLVHFCDKLL